MADLGRTRTIHAEFSADGVDTDPGTVTLTITAPNGTVTTPTPAHDGSGLYSYDLLLNQAGVWTYTFAGTGAVPASATGTITVTGAAFDGPCDNWITWAELGDYCTPAAIAAALQDAILANATRTLWTRTCKQYGTCSIVRARVVPSCRHAYAWRAGSGYVPSAYRAGCGCGSYPFVDLGTAPVVSVDHVWIDGTELDASAYRVDDWRRLVRVDGDSWPNGSSLTADEGADDTFEVSWTYGVPVPDEGKAMVALLACKLSRDLDDSCGADPSGMTQKVAEGVTIQINPPDGDTGVSFVERWLDNFHCGGGRIFDPGARPRTTRVGT